MVYYNNMQKAKLIFRSKQINRFFITELVIWELPSATTDRPHGIKYRLYCGDKKGNCIVRYDNESGKGDHKHLGNEEIPYKFVNIDRLMEDFFSDVGNLTIEEEENE